MLQFYTQCQEGGVWNVIPNCTFTNKGIIDMNGNSATVAVAFASLNGKAINTDKILFKIFIKLRLVSSLYNVYLVSYLNIVRR